MGVEMNRFASRTHELQMVSTGFGQRLSAAMCYLLCTLGALLMGLSFSGQPTFAREPGMLDAPGAEQTVGEKLVAHLYFKDPHSDFLNAENRILTWRKDPVERGTALVHALLDGPLKGLIPTLPKDTRLRALYITGDGIAYVDLSREISKGHPGGCHTEMLTIYSLVNTLILNVPEINAVKLLLEGDESFTLAGHLDIRYPLTANMLLVR